MAYVMHISFDNSLRFKRNLYYFEYKGVRFKLVQNEPRQWSDILLTITADNDVAAQQQAYSAAGEFLSALSWKNSSAVALNGTAGYGAPQGLSLREARCNIKTFPRIPFYGHITGSTINQIPAIETDEQRKALILYREGLSSNKDILSLLLYWQIMDIGKSKPEDWVNKTYYKNAPRLRAELTHDVQQLPLNGRKLGEYLRDDCRDAVAHIKRYQGKKQLVFDMREENKRLWITKGVLRLLAKHYIENELGLRNTMYLVKKDRHSFPIFVDIDFLRKNRWPLAYE